MRVLCRRPGQAWQELEIDGSLFSLQRLVGGFIEPVFYGGLVLLVNEDGINEGLPFNCWVNGCALFGPVVAVGVDGENFTSLTDSQAEKVRRIGLFGTIRW